MGNVGLQVSPSPAPFLPQIPLVPLSPALSIVLNIYLMLKLSYMTWLRFAVWLLLGECSHGSASPGRAVAASGERGTVLVPAPAGCFGSSSPPAMGL